MKEVPMNRNTVAPLEALFQKQSEMGERVMALDWSHTPLGPIEGWPQSLRMAVGICLNSRFPMFVWWGPELINIHNDAYAPILGLRHPAALGMPAREIWAELWPVIGAEVDAVIRRGEAVSHERVRLVLERNGYPEETYFTYSHSPIPDEQGGIGGLFQVCTDETAQVLAERERDRMAEQRQLALDAANMGWWHYDPNSRVAAWDDRYKEIFGVTGYQRPNDEILARIHPDDLPGVWAKVEAALDPFDPQPYATEYRIFREAGNVRWIEARGIAMFEGEGAARQATSFVGTVADITERKRAEDALLARSQEIADLNARLTRAMKETHHRVKNNLQVIAAMIEMQVLEHQNDQTVPIAEFVRLKAHVHTLAIVHDLLTRSVKEEEDAQRVSTRAVLDKLLPMLQRTAWQQSVRYTVDEAYLTSKQCIALSLVLNELVSNALKHGRKEAEVFFKVDGQNASLSVSDDGLGFPDGFDPNKAANTGLELVGSLVRTDLQGTLVYGNQPQGGGQVSVVFPLPPDEA